MGLSEDLVFYEEVLHSPTVVKGLASEPGHRDLQKSGSVWSRIWSFGVHWRPDFFNKSNILQVPRLGRTQLRAACFRAQACSRLVARLSGDVRIRMRSFPILNNPCLVHKKAFDTGIRYALSQI